MALSAFYLAVLLVCHGSAILARSTPSSARTSHVLHEKRDNPLVAWQKQARVGPKVLLPVRIGLKQQNLEQGPALLNEISDQRSPKYGQHLTAEEIYDLFAPDNKSVEAVSSWIYGVGIAEDRVSQSVNKQWIQFEATAKELESLVQTQYFNYEHLPTGMTNIACEEYHVPSHVHSHIDYITPGLRLLTPTGTQGKVGSHKQAASGTTAVPTRLPTLPPLSVPVPVPSATLQQSALKELCQHVIVPACIKRLYNITDGDKAFPRNQLGIFESLADRYSGTDLDEFFSLFASKIPLGTRPEFNSVDGASGPGTVAAAGPESSLDIQVSYPIIYPQNIVLFQADDDVYQANYMFQGFFNTFLDAIDGSYCSYTAFGEGGNSPLDPSYPDNAAGGYKGALQCGVYKPPNVLSISYGGQESDLPPAYQKRQCSEFMKLGLQGVSVVVSSGDTGVAGPALGSNPTGCLGKLRQKFSPDYPAGCPYVTAVGATWLPRGADVNIDQEQAVSRFSSGGGFSNIYPTPPYQRAAVSRYLTSWLPAYLVPSHFGVNADGDGPVFNASGRGYPDVSAVGDNIMMVNRGTPSLIGGTSASAPIFASIIVRINEERLAAKKSPVGFLNPTLYANPQCFHVMTQGSNPGCNTNGFTCSAAGWDPVTGLGTPNYPALLQAFMKR